MSIYAIISVGDTMTGMNEKVREAVRQTLKARNLTQAEAAQQIGLKQPDIARLLSGRAGKIPENWQKLLDELGLELIAVPKPKSDA